MTIQERTAWARSYPRTTGLISPRDYAAITGVDRHTAPRDLQLLVARGLVTVRGGAKDRRYATRRGALTS